MSEGMSRPVSSSSRLSGHSAATVECDGMWQSYRGARSDCEQLRGCESNGEKGCSHSCHPHTGDCQEMEICQIMFHDFVAHNKL